MTLSRNILHPNNIGKHQIRILFFSACTKRYNNVQVTLHYSNNVLFMKHHLELCRSGVLYIKQVDETDEMNRSTLDK